MGRDIDHAAVAVENALKERFGRQVDFTELKVTPHERTMTIRHDGRITEGTRDRLITAIRKANTYDELWRDLTGALKPDVPAAE